MGCRYFSCAAFMLGVGSGCTESKPAWPLAMGTSPSGDSGGSPGDTAAPIDGERVSMGAVVPCDSPLPNVVYEEVGEQMGLQAGRVDPQEHSEGGVAAVADLMRRLVPEDPNQKI